MNTVMMHSQVGNTRLLHKGKGPDLEGWTTHVLTMEKLTRMICHTHDAYQAAMEMGK
ncbi:MAG: hypothetical protein QW837_06020 [Conexivisphaerales archaeon]